MVPNDLKYQHTTLKVKKSNLFLSKEKNLFFCGDWGFASVFHTDLALISEFSKLSLATAIMVLTSVSCYYKTLCNYGGKKARDVHLTCRCHLSDIMPDSIFYDSMGWGITCLFFKGW